MYYRALINIRILFWLQKVAAKVIAKVVAKVAAKRLLGKTTPKRTSFSRENGVNV